MARITKFANSSTYSSNYRIKDMTGNSEFELAAAGSYTPIGGGSAVTVAGPIVLSNNNLTATVNILINIHTITSSSLTSGRLRLQFALDFKEHKNPTRFAEEYIPTLRSWSEATFVSGLSPERSMTDKQKIVDTFYNNYQKLVEDNPEGHGMDYVHCYLILKKNG